MQTDHTWKTQLIARERRWPKALDGAEQVTCHQYALKEMGVETGEVADRLAAVTVAPPTLKGARPLACWSAPVR